MKILEILHDLREAFTIPTKGSVVKAIILILGILIVALGISFLLLRFLPDEQQMINNLQPYPCLCFT